MTPVKAIWVGVGLYKNLFDSWPDPVDRLLLLKSFFVFNID